MKNLARLRLLLANIIAPPAPPPTFLDRFSDVMAAVGPFLSPLVAAIPPGIIAKQASERGDLAANVAAEAEKVAQAAHARLALPRDGETFQRFISACPSAMLAHVNRPVRADAQWDEKQGRWTDGESVRWARETFAAMSQKEKDAAAARILASIARTCGEDVQATASSFGELRGVTTFDPTALEAIRVALYVLWGAPFFRC